jgi:HlyD family secretion protein
MRENIKIVRDKLENLTVRAPVDGQLGQLEAEIGEQKNQGQRLGLINDLSSYKVQADIDEHYISKVITGLPSSFEFNNKEYNLKVKKVYPEVKGGRFQIDLVFTGEMPENIRVRQTFRLKVELGEPKEAIQIPKGGFFQSTGGQWIFVVDPSGSIATRRTIKVGNQNPTHYEVLEGLQPGEQVITSGYDNFGDADKLILK